MATLTFLGAAKTVTGSQYLVTADRSSVMVDCGMFQGEKDLRLRNWTEPEYQPSAIPWLVVTHTHIDHIGRVPRLVRQGFRGTIYCTPPTRALAEVLLEDAARLQQEDADYLNRKGLTKHRPARPLFTVADVQETLRRFETVPLGETRELGRAYRFTFRDAGHLLGAASVDLGIREDRRETGILFSGDLGRFDAVIATDPALAPQTDYVVVESTYGNRAHAVVPVLDQLEGILSRTFARGGVVLVPAFAVGRAQQLLYLLHRLVGERRLPPVPIHVDSPLAIDATHIYARFASALGIDLAAPFRNPRVHFHRTREESKALNQAKGPAVIISSSGMLSGGRILHHCRVRLPRPENTLMITGYQAVSTLGRALLEGAKVARIHKGEVPVLAEVTELRGLSGHADAPEILRWLSGVRTPPRRVFVTHGEEEAAEALAARITKERGFPTHVPALGETAEL